MYLKKNTKLEGTSFKHDEPKYANVIAQLRTNRFSVKSAHAKWKRDIVK
jgi:hypothetical protein